MRKVLLTGAAGRIGAAFRQHAGSHYQLRLADLRLDGLEDAGGHQVMQMNVADLEACQEACRGIDTVVHLAANPSTRADFYGSLLENNVKGVFNIFQAAKDQGCRRVVFASSVQVVEGYPLDVQAHPESPPKPLNMYAVCKCFGENVARYFADAENLSSIVVRIGSFEGDWTAEQVSARTLSTFISRRDMSHLLVRCIETPAIRFAIVHGVSDNRFKRLDITSTRQLLGYTPQDDGFRRFTSGLRYTDRWYEEWGRGGRDD